jgi:legumain
MKSFASILLLPVLLSAASAFDESVVSFEKPSGDGQHWALLVAGSNGYMNYRHQADVCHAYQILKAHGIPDERIIVMMYDDIADNRENPVKGNIINQPDGPNVYPGVPKDYTGKEVDPDVFLSVLKGEKDKVSGKVIDSGPNDHVFVNFVDHGAPGIVAFGTKRLKASQLNDAIMYMHDNNRYSKMVFYIEACESGSMFDELLPKNINVFATTASNAHESSYACYFDKTRRTYLGDVYSIKWMQDSDKEDLTTETLSKQFKITKKEVNTSHVMEFGDLSMGDMTVAEFQGMQKARALPPNPAPKDPCDDAVKSEDVPVEVLRRSIDLETDDEKRRELEERLAELLAERTRVDMASQQIVTMAAGNKFLAAKVATKRQTIHQWQCYESIVDYLQEKCPKTFNIPTNDYALRKLYMFVNMCESNISRERVISAIDKVCING